MQMICLNAKTEQSPDFDCWQCTQKALFWLFLPFLLILDEAAESRQAMQNRAFPGKSRQS
jgi:hypothetical protein